MKAMTIDQAASIIRRTSASVAGQAITYDVSTIPNADFGIIKETIIDKLDPIGHLFNPPMKDPYDEPGQIRGSIGNAKGNWCGAARVVNDDYTPHVDLDEANWRFRNHRNFAADSIEELMLAIDIVTEHIKTNGHDALIQRPLTKTEAILESLKDKQVIERDAVDEVIAISCEEPTEPVVYEEIHSEEGVLLTEAEDKQHIKDEIKRLLTECDVILKQMADVFDRPLPSQVTDQDRIEANRKAVGLM